MSIEPGQFIVSYDDEGWANESCASLERLTGGGFLEKIGPAGAGFPLAFNYLLERLFTPESSSTCCISK